MTDDSQGTERRTTPRVEWSGEVVLEIGNQRIGCKGIDLSQAGIRLVGSWVGYQGQQVKVKIILDAEPAFALGEVAWAGKGARIEGWGIRFTSVHPATRKRIASFVLGSIEAGKEIPDPTVPAKPASPPTPERASTGGTAVVMCDPALRDRIEKLLHSGRLGSASILGGAKGAVAFRGPLFVEFVGRGPVVILNPDDPLAQKLRWIAAAAATWAENESGLEHGPEQPLRIRV